MSTPDALLLQAKALIDEGRLDEAVQIYTHILDADEHHVDALIGAGHLALMLSLPEECAQFLERALSHQPDHQRALVIKGLLLEATEGPDAALAHFAQVAQAHPKDYGACYHYGRSLIVAGRTNEAIPVLQQASQWGPHNAAPHYALGMAHHKEGALDLAIVSLGRAIEVEPLYLDGYITLADVLTEAGQMQAAQDALSQAAALIPDAPVIFSKQAGIALKQRDWAKAIQALQEQRRLSPDDSEVCVSLATVALLAGEAQIFADTVAEMLEVYPQEWRTHQLHATLLDMADRPEDAIVALREAHRLAPQEWKPLNDLGDLLNAKAQTIPEAAAEAVDVLTEACQLAPTEILEPRYNLTLAYWNAGHKERAQEAATLLIQAGPKDHPLVLQTKEVLSAMNDAVR